MDTKTLTRAAAILFVGIAATVTAIGMTGDPVKQETQVRMLTRERAPSDDVRKVLRYCRDKGEMALRDPICLKVWIENRDRFFGKDKAPGGMKPAPAPPCAGEPCEKQKSKPVPRGGQAPDLPEDGMPKVKDRPEAPDETGSPANPDPVVPTAHPAPATTPRAEKGL
ncbi:putative entry exclusion protein TrbK-alt [Shinella sp. NM-101]|uniref:putative entry exclusion protein TrbK-alt n=1 Tax=Shinella sp. NM-101 TaxID=2744455 RepID=UPI001F19FEC6|nr:putative entry exclusion protein TrbK-alt [Shinella sp. NM-101]